MIKNDVITSGSIKTKKSIYFFTLALCEKTFEGLSESMSEWINKEEHDLLLSYKHPKRQHSFLLGRYSAKRSIEHSINNARHKLTDISIKKGVFGQPFLADFRDIAIGISHSHNLGAAVCYPLSCPMAIDIEKINSQKIDVIKYTMTAHEKELLKICKSEDQAKMHTMVWTIKEALAKFLLGGLGIGGNTLGIKTLEFSNSYAHTTFQYFSHIKAYSFVIDDYACTLIYPSNGDIDLLNFKN